MSVEQQYFVHSAYSLDSVRIIKHQTDIEMVIKVLARLLPRVITHMEVCEIYRGRESDTERETSGCERLY